MFLYLLLRPLLTILGHLPTSVLLRISDGLAWLLRVILRYRRAVVLDNLHKCFPEKSAVELNTIAKKFYAHLADRIVESISCIGISKNEVTTRCTMRQNDLVTHYYRQGRDIVAAIAHMGAWEWGALSSSALTQHTVYGIYNPLSNKRLNNFLVRTRQRFGLCLVSMKDVSHYFKIEKTEPSIHLFISDQSPSNPQKAYWTSFLGRDTCFPYGAVRYAQKHNTVFMCALVTQQKRGYYNIDLIPITESPGDFTADELVEKYVRLVEQRLRENPSDWLWSHRRWKHTR